MTDDNRWIFEDLLLKRWGMDIYTLFAIVEEGLPIYDKYGKQFEPDPEGADENLPYKFNMDDIEKYEQDHPYLFPTLVENLNAKEKRELGQLRREKEKWDASIDVAVQIGIFCHEQNRRMTSGEFDTKMREIDRDIQEATMRRIQKAIPSEYKSQGGRPKKDK